MVTFNKVVSDLCAVCGVDHDPTKRVTERRGMELIRECTAKVRVLTMGTAALATVLEEHLEVHEEAAIEAEAQVETHAEELPDAQTAAEELPEVPTDKDELAEEPTAAPKITAPKLGK
jgi:threonine aldolase